MYRTTRSPQPEEEVPGVTMGGLLILAGIEHCDLLKIDIEGAEYDALFGAEYILKLGR